MKNATIQDVRNQLEETLEKEQKSGKRNEKIFIGVLVFVFIWLSVVYGTATRVLSVPHILDRVHVLASSNIPEANAYLRDLAPPMVAALSDKILEVPQILGRRAMSNMDAKIDQFTTTLRNNVVAGVDHLAKEAEAQGAMAAMPEQYQYNLLMDELYRQSMASVDDFYNHSSAKLNAMKDHLSYLKNTPGLSETERLQKQVIGSWLALLDHRGVDWSLGK